MESVDELLARRTDLDADAVQLCRELSRLGVPTTELLGWVALSWRTTDLLPWQKAGFDPLIARSWYDVGVRDVGAALQWVDLGYRASDYEVFAGHHLSLSAARAWSDVDRTAAMRWVRIGVKSPRELERWKALGCDREFIAVMIREGYTVAQAERGELW